jgi:uncharacterized protein
MKSSRTRFFKDTKQNFFLFGPRGTGKSMWLKQNLPEAYYIDLLAPDTFRLYTAHPERLKQAADALPRSRTIIIDEIQKLPDLLDVVHLLTEEQKERRIIMTGSSSRKLKRAGVDLLAGRAIVKTMHPFMAAELGDDFSVSKALSTGMIPLVTESFTPRETLDSYVMLYLKEEVKSEGLLRNIGAFSRFLESASFSHGSLLNVSDVARDCQIKIKTAQGYFSIIEDLLLGFRISVFSKRAKRHLVSHPKFFYFDAGVFKSLRPSGPLDSPQEIDGPALEGLVAQHLLGWSGYGKNDCKLYFWRTKSGVEVDFVVYGKDTFCGIEVKNSARLNSKMLKGLTSFKKEYPEADVCLLYRGKEELVIKNIPCIPCDMFLKNLIPDKPILSPDGFAT